MYFCRSLKFKLFDNGYVLIENGKLINLINCKLIIYFKREGVWGEYIIIDSCVWG